MKLPATSLSTICSEIRNNIAKIIPSQGMTDWMNEVDVIIGAPGITLKTIEKNTLNLFYYKFEPFGFHANATTGETQWIKVYCIMTAIGIIDDNDTPDTNDDISAGSNELRMLSQVMRYFQENPVQNITSGIEQWHVQFIPKPLADEQINQIWSTQGELVYRPSIVYEIALAPIEPHTPSPQVAKVGSIGNMVIADITKKHDSWHDTERESRFPQVPPVSVDISNPQWAPAIIMVTGADNNRQANITLSLTSVVNPIINVPDIDILIAGDTTKAVNIVGQLLQNGQWNDITVGVQPQADIEAINIEQLPNSGTTNFTLEKMHWSNFDDTNDSWQLQLFAERSIMINNTEIRIRSNPVLITLTTQGGG